MKVTVKPVTKREAQKHTGYVIAQNGTKSDGESRGFQKVGAKSENLRNGVERIFSVKANGTGVTSS